MTPAGIVVTLTDAEQRIVRWIARQRQGANGAAGVVDRQVAGTLSGDDVHTIGFGGELAFCKLFNVYPDLDTRPRRGGADCDRLGESIDVKTTRHPNGKLLVFARKLELASDCYALMIADWPAFRFVGFVRAADVFRPEHYEPDRLGGPTYVVAQDDRMVTADQIQW